MELWFTEEHSKFVRFSIRVDKQLVSLQSEFQRIDVFENKRFGKILTLDGLLMLTERDEFIYHDMITHVAMAVSKNIKNVLVIGGGDGGAVRELCKYSSIEKIDLVEIDSKVVEVCREFIPSVSSKFDDKRVNIHFTDGLKFIRDKENLYDLIIVDSTDPFGPGEGLFTKQFYGNCFKALTDDGVLINQMESVFYSAYEESMKKAYSRVSAVFPISMLYSANIPTYPSGNWLFGFSSKTLNPVKDFDPEYWNSLNIETKYYNTKLHQGAFALPNYVKEKIRNEED